VTLPTSSPPSRLAAPPAAKAVSKSTWHKHLQTQEKELIGYLRIPYVWGVAVAVAAALRRLLPFPARYTVFGVADTATYCGWFCHTAFFIWESHKPLDFLEVFVAIVWVKVRESRLSPIVN